MKILSIDIGGTYSRFGDFTVSKNTLKKNNEPFKIQTKNEKLDSLSIHDGDAKYKDTIRMFSRFFGRACKNYCLSTFTTQSLIITGGVASNIRSVVTNTEFYDAFIHSRHRHILSNIDIYLNPGIETGLLGGAYFGMCHISKQI